MIGFLTYSNPLSKIPLPDLTYLDRQLEYTNLDGCVLLHDRV